MRCHDENCADRNDRPLHQYHRHPYHIKAIGCHLYVAYNVPVRCWIQNRPRTQIITLQARLEIGRSAQHFGGRIQLLEYKLCTQQSTSHHPPPLGYIRCLFCGLWMLLQRADVILEYLSRINSTKNCPTCALFDNLVKRGG